MCLKFRHVRSSTRPAAYASRPSFHSEPCFGHIFWGIGHALHATSDHDIVDLQLDTLCRKHDSCNELVVTFHDTAVTVQG